MIPWSNSPPDAMLLLLPSHHRNTCCSRNVYWKKDTELTNERKTHIERRSNILCWGLTLDCNDSVKKEKENKNCFGSKRAWPLTHVRAVTCMHTVTWRARNTYIKMSDDQSSIKTKPNTTSPNSHHLDFSLAHMSYTLTSWELPSHSLTHGTGP